MNHTATQLRSGSPESWFYLLWACIGLLVLVALGVIWQWATHPPAAVHPRGASVQSPVPELARQDDVDDAEAQGAEIDFQAWWPSTVHDAARLYHCIPAVPDAAGGLSVWTDNRNRVVAYASSFEGGLVPAYASRLGAGGTSVQQPVVHAADPGFRVSLVHRSLELRLGDQALSCVPSNDD